MTVKVPEAYISSPLLHFPVSRLTHTALRDSVELDASSLVKEGKSRSQWHTQRYTALAPAYSIVVAGQLPAEDK